MLIGRCGDTFRAKNAELVRCVWIDRTKAYADISLCSWVAVCFIAVQEVLAAHTMVISMTKSEGMLRDVRHRSLVLPSLGNQ